MVMKVSVRPLRSRADELMISPFRRIEVGAMVGARGAINGVVGGYPTGQK